MRSILTAQKILGLTWNRGCGILASFASFPFLPQWVVTTCWGFSFSRVEFTEANRELSKRAKTAGI